MEERRTTFDWHDDGVLWLINRVVFHPRGFALTREKGADPEWFIQGDGSEPWTFASDVDDELFGAVSTLLEHAAAPDDEMFDGGTR